MTVFIFFSLPALAQDANVYTIKDVKVDVSAASATAARDQAFAQAQQMAFSQLAEQILPAESFKSFKTPEAKTISPMVKDFEVTNEQLSAVRYIGTYTFRFRNSAVDRYFGQSGQAEAIGDVVQNAATGGYASSHVSTNVVRATARFSSIGEWITLQRVLRRLSGVGSVKTVGLSMRQATVDFGYEGTEDTLRATLAQQGLNLSPAPNYMLSVY